MDETKHMLHFFKMTRVPLVDTRTNQELSFVAVIAIVTLTVTAGKLYI